MTHPNQPHRPAGLTRRQFNGIFGASAIAAGLGLQTLGSRRADAAEREFQADMTAAAETGAPRPNFLVILADDIGWADLACYGSRDIATPNLDALARGGVRFTDGYAASSTCSPTRIALYTGRYPGRLEAGLAEPMTYPRPDEGIPPEHPTLASLLAGAGYETAMYGKWHCGSLPWYSVQTDADTTNPTDHLYDLPADPREQADLAEKNPDVLADLRASWEAIDAVLLPYPPEPVQYIPMD